MTDKKITNSLMSDGVEDRDGAAHMENPQAGVEVHLLTSPIL